MKNVKWSIHIKVILFLFIVYAIYSGHRAIFDKIPEKLSQTLTPSTEQQTQEGSSISSSDITFKASDGSSFMERWFSYALNKVLDNPNGKAMIHSLIQQMIKQQGDFAAHDLIIKRYNIQDKVIGNGIKAECGDKVEVAYNMLKEHDAKTSHVDTVNHEESVVLTLGSNNKSESFESGVVGMQPGGSRIISYPDFAALKDALYDATKDKKLKKIYADVTLKTIIKQQEDKLLGRPFFDKPRAQMMDVRLICGDKVLGSYILHKLDGTVLYDSQSQQNKFAFRIGGDNDHIPKELSDAIMGLHVNQADISFIAPIEKIKQAFQKLPNFIPDTTFDLKPEEIVVLSFNLAKER